MQEKDYYQILQVPHSASPEEIKRSFRKLAVQYHPDKNEGNSIAEERFKEIKEAYEILYNTEKRQDYHYKRFASVYEYSILTPGFILKQCLELKKFTSVIQHYHINYDLLSHQIREILSEQSLAVLEKENDLSLNKNILQLMIDSSDPLPYPYFLTIAPILLSLSQNEKNTATIQSIILYKKRVHTFEKNKLLIAVIIASILCILIYRATD